MTEAHLVTYNGMPRYAHPSSSASRPRASRSPGNPRRRSVAVSPRSSVPSSARSPRTDRKLPFTQGSTGSAPPSPARGALRSTATTPPDATPSFLARARGALRRSSPSSRGGRYGPVVHQEPTTQAARIAVEFLTLWIQPEAEARAEATTYIEQRLSDRMPRPTRTSSRVILSSPGFCCSGAQSKRAPARTTSSATCRRSFSRWRRSCPKIVSRSGPASPPTAAGREWPRRARRRGRRGTRPGRAGRSRLTPAVARAPHHGRTPAPARSGAVPGPRAEDVRH